MTEDPASKAHRLVRRARNRAFRHAAGRSLLRGFVVAALGAAALAAAARLAGLRVGPWLLVALLPGAGVAARGLLGARPTLSRAALLLDRSAGTRERFVSALGAGDPEVRDLVARQALESLGGESHELAFRPTTEGLLAALSAALLAAALFVPTPRSEEAEEPRSNAPSGPGIGTPSAGAPEAGGEREGGSPPAAPDPARALARLAEGARLSEVEWKAIEGLGAGPDRIAESRALAEAGNSAAAADLLRRALAAGTVEPRASSGAGPGRDWDGYVESMESPEWSPRFDRVVRRYFTRAGEEGLR